MAVVLLVVLGAAAAAIALVAHRGSPGLAAGQPHFSAEFTPYVDATATPEYPFEDGTAGDAAMLAFVVSAPDAACQPSWGAYYSLDAAAKGIDLDRRIALLREHGGSVAISFGGAANSELAIGCTDPTELAAAYTSVVARYDVAEIDLDLESRDALAPDVLARRAAAIAQVQRQRAADGHPLAVWLTLPVAESGLTTDGVAAVTAMLAAHVRLAGVNAMTMDYGQPLTSTQTMLGVIEASLRHVERQVRGLYRSAGSRLDTDAAWQHVGMTPMLGQNDTPDEQLSVAAARSLAAFAEQRHVGRISMWSANRDQPCGANYPDVTTVSDNCSGVTQTIGRFATIFGKYVRASGSSAPVRPPSGGATATPSASGTATGDDTAPDAGDTVDNPADSPYQIWNPLASYAANTKVVWHHNVYLATYWTQGVEPDAPVADGAGTPWELLGPVLPGEHPLPTPTLAPGTYPVWSPTTVYVSGDHVQYRGVGYVAKWWTQDDVPGAAVLSPSDTPWQALSSP